MSADSTHRAFHRGRHLQAEGNYEAAIRAFRQVTCCASHRRNALYSLSECYLKTEHTAEALEALREIVSQYPDDAMGALCLGQLLLKRGEHAEGLKRLEESIELSRAAAEKCLERSREALTRGEPSLAAREVIQASRYFDQQVRVQQWLVRFYLDRGEPERALRVLARADLDARQPPGSQGEEGSGVADVYKCAKCGKTSPTRKSCCGIPMLKVS